MPQNTKLTLLQKINAVKDYLSGREGPIAICAKLNIAHMTLYRWKQAYEEKGVSGLIPAQRLKKYSVELKLQVVKEYLSGDATYAALCSKYDISDTHIVARWVKKYNGHENFRQPGAGGRINMTKGRKTTQDERIEIVSHCIANSKNYGETIEQYGVSYQQIYSWVRKYEAGGIDALLDRRGKRKDIASMSEVERLHAQLKLAEAENLRLQMENELLKKLEALERGTDEG